MKIYLFYFFAGIILYSCSEVKTQHLDIQGHRGCRGLLPENTIAGFIEAVKLGVHTLEMDVVISADSQVVVSHEPWFNFEISTSPNGNTFTEEEGNCINLFKLNYTQIAKYDVGLKSHPRFTQQKKIQASKPLLIDVFNEVDSFCRVKNIKLPNFNIEIKSTVKEEKLNYQPAYNVFSDLVINLISSTLMQTRCTIQSFDMRILQYIHKKYPQQQLALLIEYNADYNQAIKNLGFKPEIYSCHYTYVNQEMINDLHRQQIKVIPWTVNKVEDMKNLINQGVDGIITDYPDSLIALVKTIIVG